MTAPASALAHAMVQNTEDDVRQALSLYISVRPQFREAAQELLAEDALRRYEGRIEQFNRQKGFGFIRSEELTEEFGGKDTFLSDKEIGNFQVNDTVTFTAVVNRDNKPQARLLQAAGATVGAPHLSAPSKQPHPQHWAPVWGEAAAFTHSLNEPAHKAQRRHPPAAVVPAVTPLAPRRIGSPAVLPVAGAPPVPMPPAPVRPAGADQARRSPAIGGAAVPPAPPPAVLPASAVALGLAPPSAAHRGAAPEARYVGTITSFFAEKHYGFIASPAVSSIYGKDTFVSDMEIGSFQVGDQVTFSIVLNAKGNPQARQLKPARQPAFGGQFNPASEDGAGEDDPTRYSGVITNFSPEKHYGFIQCREVMALTGKDVFVSDKEIGSFSIGSAVSFRVVRNRQGNPQARDLMGAEDEEEATAEGFDAIDWSAVPLDLGSGA